MSYVSGTEVGLADKDTFSEDIQFLLENSLSKFSHVNMIGKTNNLN